MINMHGIDVSKVKPEDIVVTERGDRSLVGEVCYPHYVECYDGMISYHCIVEHVPRSNSYKDQFTPYQCGNITMLGGKDSEIRAGVSANFAISEMMEC